LEIEETGSLTVMPINRIKFDCNESVTDLCRIGGRHGTDKSPLNTYVSGGLNYRHAYTAVYDFLFSRIREDHLVIAEIGVFKGAGLKTLREYFPQAELYGFEFNDTLIEATNRLALEKTTVNKINVRSASSIRDAMLSTGRLFDIIIDDSSHDVDDQVRVIQECKTFLAPGGYLIIEDVFDDERSPEVRFEQVIDNAFRCATFVYPQSDKIEIGQWNNEKLLLLVKS
jgi:SAM-dependent methyltransferase